MIRYLVVLCLLIPAPCFAVTISGVPAYNTNGGAGSGALQILAYYDMHGYSNMFAADAPEIYSNAALAPELDLFNSIVPNHNGYVHTLDIPPAIEQFAAIKGYSFKAQYIPFYQFPFTDYQAEIDAGRPVKIATDNNSDGSFTVLSMSGVGYDFIDGIPYYGFVSSMTGLTDVIWKPWVIGDVSYPWGVTSVITITPQSAAPVPEPSTMILLGFGLISGMILRNRNRLK